MKLKVKKKTSNKDRMQVHYSSARGDWGTPQAFFDALNDEFSFTLDAAASRGNAKCKTYVDEKANAFLRNWSTYGGKGRKHSAVYLNPPYGRKIARWIEYALSQSRKHKITVVLLLPARTDTRWFHDFCIQGEVRLLKGRLHFDDGAEAAPFPNMVVVFGPRVKPRIIPMMHAEKA